MEIAPPVIRTAAPAAALPCAKKILFVTHSGQYGGLEKHVLYMVRRLLGSGAEISIFNQGPDFFTAHLEGAETAEVLHVANNDAPMSFWDWFRLFRSVRPDVIVLSFGWIGSFPSYPLPRGWPGCAGALLSNSF